MFKYNEHSTELSQENMSLLAKVSHTAVSFFVNYCRLVISQLNHEGSVILHTDSFDGKLILEVIQKHRMESDETFPLLRLFFAKRDGRERGVQMFHVDRVISAVMTGLHRAIDIPELIVADYSAGHPMFEFDTDFLEKQYDLKVKEGFNDFDRCLVIYPNTSRVWDHVVTSRLASELFKIHTRGLEEFILEYPNKHYWITKVRPRLEGIVTYDVLDPSFVEAMDTVAAQADEENSSTGKSVDEVVQDIKNGF